MSMKETPRVVINRARRVETPAGPRAFTFAQNQVRLSGASDAVRGYRQKAWEIFQSTPIPEVREEAWRRTDLKGLRAEAFRLPEAEAYLDLPDAPASLLEPLVGDAHGGQVLLLAGGAKTHLDPDLVRQGVVFTDLRTAEKEHPELVDRMIGKVVSPGDGKFAALARWPRMGWCCTSRAG